MKIQNIITCINENTTYTEFVKLWSFSWKRITNSNLVIGIVGKKAEDAEFVEEVKKVAEVRLFPEVSGIDSGIQAKITRMVLAASDHFKYTNCMIVDIDMIPLNERVLLPFENVPEDADMVRWGIDHPSYSKNTPDHGKWPMDRTIVKNDFFKKIINPKNLNYKETIEQWIGFNCYGRESITLPYNQFSDESLLRALLINYQKNNVTKIIDIKRKTLESHMMSGRLDRAGMANWNSEQTLRKLRSKEIFEVHGVRPFLKNIKYYEDILNYFNLNKEDVK